MWHFCAAKHAREYACCQWGWALRGGRVACLELSEDHHDWQRASAPADSQLPVPCKLCGLLLLWRLPLGSLNRWCLGAVEGKKTCLPGEEASLPGVPISEKS
ncbi:MAG: hypothetical protein MUC60_13900 [Oscillatoria sp. Prado101]|nr:hypothetical protein [Oscillatoria sp. Prado101]